VKIRAAVACVLVLGVLSALSGFHVAAAGAPPIQLSPRNPHYFLFRGQTIALVTSGEHYGAVLSGDFDFHKYLATISGAGLNMTRLFGGSYVEVPGQSFGIKRNDLAPAPGKFVAPWRRAGTDGYAGGGGKFDLTQWNPEYFGRLHAFLDDAAQKGIVVELTLFSAHYGEAQWNLSPFNPANNVNGTAAMDWKKLNTLDNGNILGFQEAYARKLVHEIAAYDNVILEIQNEPWSDRPVFSGVINPYLFPPNRDRFPNSIDLPDDLEMAFQTRVAEWIASEESALPAKHLVSQNFSNFRYAVPATIPGVSIVSFHYAYPEAASWNLGLSKAISYDETGFLGRDDDAYRRQAWNFMMAGGGVFDALDYSFSPGHEDGSDSEPNGPGGGSAELRRQLKVLLNFLGAMPLEQTHPDGGVVAIAPGVVARALSFPAHAYAIYFDGSHPAPSDFTLTLPVGSYHAEWLDVKTGAVRRDEIYSDGNAATVHAPAFTDGVALRVWRDQ
jgi:hypothetical protein